MLKTLLKCRFAEMFFGLKKSFRGSKNNEDKMSKGRIALLAFLGIYLVVVFGALFALMFMEMGDTLSNPDFVDAFGGKPLLWIAVSIEGLMALMLSFVGSVFMTQTQIYNAQDNDFLLSLPIKPAYILLSRMVLVFSMNGMFSYFVAIFAGVGLLISDCEITLVGVIFYVVLNLLLPFFSMAATLLLAWVISVLTRKMKRKNIISLILTIGFFLVYFYACFNLNNYIEKLLENLTGIGESISGYMYPIYKFGVAIANHDIASFFITIGFFTIPFVIVVYILSKTYFFIVKTSNNIVKVKYVKKEMKTTSPVWALVKKDLSRLFASSMYLLNTMSGILMEILLVLAVVMKIDQIDQIKEILQGFPLAVIMTLLLVLIGSMNMVTASIISVEGKNLWLMKSVPLKAKDIFQAKLLTGLVITMPVSLISLIAFAFVLEFSVVDTILGLILLSAATLFFNYFGFKVNLTHARFDYENEVLAAKQSMSCFIAMFGSMGFSLLIAAVVVVPYFLFDWATLTLTQCLVSVILIGFCYLLRTLIYKDADEKMKALG
ncbi:MAG: hypothetical protein MJ113_05445 [Lachnospiraceae bacterium]|nr:hypothetical protein [Lachnospiraceae bacterium]